MCLNSSPESSYAFTSLKVSYPTSLKLQNTPILRYLCWRDFLTQLSLLAMASFIVTSDNDMIHSHISQIPGTGRPFLISVLSSVLVWLALICNKEKESGVKSNSVEWLVGLSKCPPKLHPRGSAILKNKFSLAGCVQTDLLWHGLHFVLAVDQYVQNGTSESNSHLLCQLSHYLSVLATINYPWLHWFKREQTSSYPKDTGLSCNQKQTCVSAFKLWFLLHPCTFQSFFKLNFKDN